MIRLRTRAFWGVGGIPAFLDKITYVSFALFVIIASLCIHNCSSIPKPNTNEFLNETNWSRKGYQKLAYHSKFANVFLYAEEFAQAKAVYIEIFPIVDLVEGEETPNELDELRLVFNQKNILLDYMEWGYRGFLGLPPRQKIGESSLTLSYIYQGKEIHTKYKVMIKKTKFQTFKKNIQLGKHSSLTERAKKEIQEFIVKSIEMKKGIFNKKTENKIDNEVAHPRDEHYITSEFWVKRHYKRYSYKKRKNRKRKKVYHKPKIRYHHGLDLRGRPGTPIYSIASGTVILAARLYFEGNYTIIDHGNHIFSGYMHQKEILVEPGDEISAGEKIGYVGSTGAVTGPHLHIFVRIGGVYIDPLSMLELPIRN